MIWLGEKRGYILDWATQLWVKATGKKVRLQDFVWLDGPSGSTRGVGKECFEMLAKNEGLAIRKNHQASGILPDIHALSGEVFNASQIQEGVKDFYQKTVDYELDAWSEWHGLFKPFGSLLAFVFSRRLQQLNVPLSNLETSQGMTNEVWRLSDDNDEETVRYIAWIRRLRSNHNILYAGSYGTCQLPNADDPCLKVVFPLPNGRALVIMRPKLHGDGSVSLISDGGGFGESGFYFVVDEPDGFVWARYVKTMKESIHVYQSEDEGCRADHRLQIFGVNFLNLHYRMRPIRKNELSRTQAIPQKHPEEEAKA